MAEIQLMDAPGVQIAKQSNLDMWQGYQFGRPGLMVEFFEDFLDGTSSLSAFDVTEVGTATQAIADEHGGILLLTNSAADNDATTLQLGNSVDGTTGETLLPAAGKFIYLETRLKKSDATQADWLFGATVIDTTPLSEAAGYFFQKDDGDTQVDLWVNGSTTLNIATDDTSYHIYGIKIVGVSQVEFWIDNVLKATLPFTGTATEVRPTFHIQDGEAVAKTMSIDYLMVAATR